MRSEYSYSNCLNCKVYHQSIFCTVSKSRPISKKKLKFTKGESIYLENQDSDGVYCIKTGQVEILKKDMMNVDRMIGMALPGELLGASSLMVNSETYSTSGIAFRPVEVCFISNKDMMHILMHNPKIAMNLMRKLADKLFDLEPYM